MKIWCFSRKEALDYINTYFETYPGVKKFLDQQVTDGKEQGYVTTMYGRRRPIPELKSANFMQKSFGERVAMNSPIQERFGYYEIGQFHVDQEMAARITSRIVLQVHDELLIEALESEAEEVKAILEDQNEACGRAVRIFGGRCKRREQLV